MIKKNLFLLFCFYLFVVQLLIAGLLRQDSKFFILALVNLVVILSIAIFGGYKSDNTESKDSKDLESKGNENKVVSRVSQGKKKNISNIRFFIVAILAGILVWLLQSNIVMHFRILFSIIVSYIVYLLLGLLFGSKIFKSKISWIYIVALILSGIRSIINLCNLLGFMKNGVVVEENTGSVMEVIDELDIIGTGIIDNSAQQLTGEDFTGDIDSGENLTGLVDSGINNDMSGNIENLNGESDVNLGNPTSLATFRDVLKFLFKDTTLDLSTNLSFQNISKSDPDYAYFRTAFEKRMVGTDVLPNQKPTCSTFVVMKGLAEGWDIGTYTNIKDAYWKYASANGKLPDCKYGNYIKIGEMK